VFYPTADDEQWMRQALLEASKALPLGEVPIGAVIVLEGHVIGQGCNRRETDADPTAHAELVAIRHAAQTLGRWNLMDATLYVTVEPCPMCAGAIWMARLSRVVYGISEPKTGAVHSRYELLSDGRLGRTVLSVGGCLADEARLLLERFFETHRATDTTKEPF
jgi:tRNA(adenine34) deaminase